MTKGWGNDVDDEDDNAPNHAVSNDFPYAERQTGTRELITDI